MTRRLNDPDDWLSELENADFSEEDDEGYIGHCYDPSPGGIVLTQEQSEAMHLYMAEPKVLPFWFGKVLPIREVRP